MILAEQLWSRKAGNTPATLHNFDNRERKAELWKGCGDEVWIAGRESAKKESQLLVKAWVAIALCATRGET